MEKVHQITIWIGPTTIISAYPIYIDAKFHCLGTAICILQGGIGFQFGVESWR